MTDAEFWLQIRRSFLALAAAIEKRYSDTDDAPPPSLDEARTVSRRR